MRRIEHSMTVSNRARLEETEQKESKNERICQSEWSATDVEIGGSEIRVRWPSGLDLNKGSSPLSTARNKPRM